jgi:acetyltransferase
MKVELVLNLSTARPRPTHLHLLARRLVSATKLTCLFPNVTHLDYRHEMAFIALDEDTGHMLGLVRLKDELDEETAEFAILVRSRLKGHGLGWLLMRRAIDYAKEKGLRRVYGDVLAGNTTMLQMCAEFGFHTEDMGSDLRRVVLDLENVSSQ